MTTDTRRWQGMDAVGVFAMYDQTDYWIDQQGERHQIAEMPTRYLRTIRRFMKRNGPLHCLNAVWRVPFSQFNGDMAQFIAEHEFMRMLDTLLEWAEFMRMLDTLLEWADSEMRKAPLYRAVCAELRDRKRLVRTYKVRHWTDREVPTYREAVPF